MIQVPQVLIWLGFVLWFFWYAKWCPCDEDTTHCVRRELYGFQISHFFFFALLGYLYPDRFWFYMILGALWELFEYKLSQNPEFIRGFGGCLSRRPKVNPDPLGVYRGVPKEPNFVDSYLGIHNSTEHTWHYSIGELLTNAAGFLSTSSMF